VKAYKFEVMMPHKHFEFWIWYPFSYHQLKTFITIKTRLLYSKLNLKSKAKRCGCANYMSGDCSGYKPNEMCKHSYINQYDYPGGIDFTCMMCYKSDYCCAKQGGHIDLLRRKLLDKIADEDSKNTR